MPHFSDDLYDVAIIGYGPTGAVAANLLGREGFRTLVIEREAAIYDKPRAIAFDHEIMRVFQSIGLAEEVQEFTGAYRPARYIGAQGQEIRRIDPAPAPYPLYWKPSYMFNQPGLESVLRQGAGSRPTVTIALEHEVTALEDLDDSVRISVTDIKNQSQHSVNARYVFACDGASSPVRTRLGIGLEDLGFDEQWIVIDVHVKDLSALPETHIQYCEPTRPMTYVIGCDNHRRWEMMLLPGEVPDEISREERILELLSRWGPPENFNIWRSAVYRFHALVAERWRSDRTFILGDAAHQTPPFMGQGMCQGIRDADNLVWKLIQVDRHGADDKLFDSYQSERKPHVRALTQFTKELGEVICEQDPDAAAARDARMVEELESGRMVTVRHKLIPSLTDGLIDLGTDSAPIGPAGELFRQPVVRTQKGDELPMNDAVGQGFWLVCLDSQTVNALSEPALEIWRHLGGWIVVMDDPPVDEPAAEINVLYLREMNGLLQGQFDEHGCRSMIVRPDRYIYGGAGTVEDLTRQLSDVENWLAKGTGPAR